MSHNKQQLEFSNQDEDQEFDMQKELDLIVGNSNRNKSSRNNNVRVSHSEKPSKNKMNGMISNQPLYSIPKHPNYLPDNLQ